MKNALPTTDALLVVQVPYFLKPGRRQELWEQILKMKESGVVLLDAMTRVLVVPKNVEIRFKDSDKAQKFYDDALDAFKKYASEDEIEKNENSQDKEESDT